MSVALDKIEYELSFLVEALNCKLVRVAFIKTGRNKILQVMIEKMDGRSATMKDCEDVGRALSVKLDVIDPISERYSLEVSSTGPDRPLVKSDDFKRFCGKSIVVKTYVLKDGQKIFKGILESATDDGITLKFRTQLQNGFEEVDLRYNEISSAHIDGFLDHKKGDSLREQKNKNRIKGS
ncbi:MAG: ribosome maturation factor RimP [Holosporales bacterium]|jgi:ribosome maturation factor RimP|nr:ribosome maturation factor RimP [Holosporales bacterium]